MNDQNDHVPADGGQTQDRAGIAYLPSRNGPARPRDPVWTRPPEPKSPLDEVSRRAAVIVDTGRARGGGRVQLETIRQLRRLGVPGYRTDVIPAADLDALGDERYELVHLATGGSAVRAAIAGAGERGIPVVAAGDTPDRGPYLRDCGLVLSPTRATDAVLAELGVAETRIARWEPGIDRELFGPARYSAAALPAPADAGPPARRPFHVLCAGPLQDECDLWLVVRAFLAARERDPRLQLVLAGCGDPRAGLCAALGATVTLLDADDPEQLARIYASADLFVSPESGEGFGACVLEAQASGLPVLAVDGSGPGELIESGRSGCLVAPDPEALGAAIRGLARRAALRERLVTGGLLAARERTWERSLMDLAVSWERAVSLGAAEVTRAA